MVYGSFDEEANSVWNFVRCQRPNGTFYASPSDKCLKGSEVGAKEGRGVTQKPTSPLNTAKYNKLMQRAEELEKAARGYLNRGFPETAARVSKNAASLRKQAKALQGGAPTASPLKPTSQGVKIPQKKESTIDKAAAAEGGKVLRNYILGGSMETGSMLETNMKLRGVSKGEMSQKEKDQVQSMDSILNTLPRNPGQTHYRGLYLDPDKDKEYISSLKRGGVIRDGGFSSYSRDRGQAEMFADQGVGKPFIIVSKSPQLRDVRKFAPEDYEDQEESIMPRNTSLKINRIEESNGITYIFTS
jgi:hypothetical protein